MRNSRMIATFTKSLVVTYGLSCCATRVDAQEERFEPREANAIEVWRITNDPTVRDHANYHNTQCWSPDGRYLCFTHYAAIRRLFYQQGRLGRREYHDRDGNHVSTEHFGPDGHVTESVQHGATPRHWWYDRGVPLRYTRGPQVYVKDGTRWVTDS